MRLGPLREEGEHVRGVTQTSAELIAQLPVSCAPLSLPVALLVPRVVLSAMLLGCPPQGWCG